MPVNDLASRNININLINDAISKASYVIKYILNTHNQFCFDRQHAVKSSHCVQNTLERKLTEKLRMKLFSEAEKCLNNQIREIFQEIMLIYVVQDCALGT